MIAVLCVALICVTVLLCFRLHVEYSLKKIDARPLAEMHLKLEAMNERLAKIEYSKLR